MRHLSGRTVLALSLIALVGTTGCTRIRTQQGYRIDQPLVDSIQPGIDNRESVEGTLGRPSFAGQFDDKDWYYVARTSKQLAFASPRPVEQTILHVRFDDGGNVVSVQKTGMENVVNLSPDHHVTPTLGRNRSLFQEIFGNIGAVGAGGVGGNRPSGDNTGPNGS